MVSHNSSPVQDEMTVNMAIRGVKKNGITKKTALKSHKAVTEVRNGAMAVDKENSKEVLLEEGGQDDSTIVVSVESMAITNKAVLRATQNRGNIQELGPGVVDDGAHARNFSVNLPYASKTALHTNMSTLQASKKPSAASNNHRP